MAPARSHQDEGSDAPQSGTLSASPTAAATVAGDSTTNGRHGRENENGNEMEMECRDSGPVLAPVTLPSPWLSPSDPVDRCQNKPAKRWSQTPASPWVLSISPYDCFSLGQQIRLTLGPRRCKAEATCVRRTAYVIACSLQYQTNSRHSPPCAPPYALAMGAGAHPWLSAPYVLIYESNVASCTSVEAGRASCPDPPVSPSIAKRLSLESNLAKLESRLDEPAGRFRD
ncbi:hypothetical protein EV126DRAFT_447168 [Verticillium dahliae]|nr:hypothetical protein EV126DRAFT_447168 [Verticillium dahliae]